LVGMNLLFKNTTVTNVGGISFNNLKRLKGWDSKTRQCLYMELNFFYNGSMSTCPWRRGLLEVYQIMAYTSSKDFDRNQQHS
jgi:hypothetical protein